LGIVRLPLRAGSVDLLDGARNLMLFSRDDVSID
jgi:hypothetical protein